MLVAELKKSARSASCRWLQPPPMHESAKVTMLFFLSLVRNSHIALPKLNLVVFSQCLSTGELVVVQDITCQGVNG